MTFRVVDEVAVEPGEWKVYAEGWQSWSPTTWYSAGQQPHRPAKDSEHVMRFRPGTALPEDEATFQGEGLVVVVPATGKEVWEYSAADPSHEVGTIRVTPKDGRLVVSADAAVEVSRVGQGPGPALALFGETFAAAAGIGSLKAPATAWCSWYRYFVDVTRSDIEENLAAFDKHDLDVDVVQIDDGWSKGLGEWLAPTEALPSLPSLVDRIRDTGRQPGIWLAPFLVGVDTEVARRNPEWLTGYAGRNWGQDVVGLDLTDPGVRDYLGSSLRRLRELGVSYFKLDFLYAGAVPGERREDVSAVEAYRSGLSLVREAVGPDAFLLGCGAPILPSVGFFDAMRVSPDTYHEGGGDGSEGLRGRMSLVARAWQQGRFWVNDPDCVVANPTYRLRERWEETARTYGGLRSFSDRVAELDTWGLETVRALLLDRPAPTPFADDVLAASVEDAG